MIAFVKGRIAAVAEDNVVIDTGGIGYNVRISAGTAQLLPGPGQEIKLYTYTHIREEMFQLYGFLTGDDLEIFKKIISVSGIGPKGGLAVLSVMSADDLRFAIISGDAKAIAKAPGIGIRTAERIILDLRGKISAADTLIGQEMNAAEAGTRTDAHGQAVNEAVEALVALGYGAGEALRAVNKAGVSEHADTEALLKAALKNMF